MSERRPGKTANELWSSRYGRESHRGRTGPVESTPALPCLDNSSSHQGEPGDLNRIQTPSALRVLENSPAPTIGTLACCSDVHVCSCLWRRLEDLPPKESTSYNRTSIGVATFERRCAAAH